MGGCTWAGDGSLIAWVSLAPAPVLGPTTPADGAGGELSVPMAAPAGAAGTVCAAGAALRTGGLGMYSGPVWPQADSVSNIARPAGSANGDFTIRITV
jgi:hypothetical protein